MVIVPVTGQATSNWQETFDTSDLSNWEIDGYQRVGVGGPGPNDYLSSKIDPAFTAKDGIFQGVNYLERTTGSGNASVAFHNSETAYGTWKTIHT